MLAHSARIGLALLALHGSAAAEPHDDAVFDQAAEAMAGDYAEKHYTAARKKLEALLKKCGKRGCSKSVRAELHRNLGVVFFALGKKRQAQTAFEKAVQLDPDARLDSDLATPALSQAFRNAGGEVGEPKAEPESEPEEAESEPDTDSDEAEATSEPASRESRKSEKAAKRAWLSLNVQQDLLIHQRTEHACGGTSYNCFQADGSEYAGPIWPVYGNQVKGGVALATTRVLLGFDLLVSENVQLGTRLGIAFGAGPTSPRVRKFVPAHGELRVAYFFGRNPFVEHGVRPYLALAAGFAEIQSRVALDYYEDAAAYNAARQSSLDAWTTAGRIFVSPSLGSQFALGSTTALTFEARLMTLFGTFGLAPAGSVGLVQGL